MRDSSPSPSAHPVSVQSVHLRYGKVDVLRGVSLDIHAAEGVVLLGANGSGKSTLMRTLNRLARPHAGEILIHGESVTQARSSELRKIRRRMGYVFQQFNLVNQLSVFQNVLMGKLGAQRFGLLNCIAATASHADREYAMACLERVGMAERAAQRPTELSGGQQQRVAIARMLMQAPSLVIADEPIASLDPRGGREVLDLLWEIVRENNLAMLCTLHQLDLARHYADRIVGIKNGVTALDATASQINDAELSELYDGANSPTISPELQPT
ncbi:MAG: phosphonate ABC transporter ATP-binding protein [Pseudomonadota bacterium]